MCEAIYGKGSIPGFDTCANIYSYDDNGLTSLINQLYYMETTPHGCLNVALYNTKQCSTSKPQFVNPYTFPNTGETYTEASNDAKAIAPFFNVDFTCLFYDYNNGWKRPPFGCSVPFPTTLPSGTSQICQLWRNCFQFVDPTNQHPSWVSGNATYYYNLLANTQIGCIKFYPTFDFYAMSLTARKTRYSTTGTFGDNFQPGLQDYNYLPAFVQITVTAYISLYLDGAYAYDTLILDDGLPRYFTADLSTQNFNNLLSYIPVAPIPVCSECYNQLNPSIRWNDFLYFQDQTWQDSFVSGTQVVIYIKSLAQNWIPLILPGSISVNGDGLSQANPSLYNIFNFVHLTTFINTTNSGTWQWDLSSCLAVNSSAFTLRLCQEANNYICQYDYLPYASVSGYNCLPCGPNGKSNGGIPTPGISCFTAHPLANATLYPKQNIIANAYETNTLFQYVDANAPPSVLNLDPTINYISGVAYDKFKNGFSNRGSLQGGGSTTGTGIPSWCDLAITKIWSKDCTALGYNNRNPLTNVVERVCAIDESNCLLTDPVIPGGDMNPNFIPPIYNPITNPSLAYTDPTCGYAINLYSYWVYDKFGAPQSELMNNMSLLSFDSSSITVHIIQQPATIFNSGKTNTKYVFSWNNTAVITFQYYVASCPLCNINSEISIFIYPLNVGYDPLTTLINSPISYPIVVGSIQTISFSFTVTETDTGVTIINGQSFPTIAYQGVGINLTAIPTSTTIQI